MRRTKPVLLLLVLVLLGIGCAKIHAGATSPPASASARDAESPLAMLAAGKRDCLQYPVGKFADGTEDWNADWVFFTLVSKSDSLPAKDGSGHPLAAGLLFSQADRFVREHGVMPGTAWTYVVKRTKRHVRDGRVLSQSDYVVVDDVDLADLLKKDQLARAQ